MHSPPASATVSGLTAAAGAEMAMRSVPPFLAGVDEVEPPDDDEDEEPHAARTAPSNGADIPIMLPRRRNVRLSMWPAASSSMQ